MFSSPLKDGVIVLVILLLFFGPKRLPMLSRSIGESIREFKGGISHESSEPPEIGTAPSTPAATGESTPDSTKQTV